MGKEGRARDRPLFGGLAEIGRCGALFFFPNHPVVLGPRFEETVPLPPSSFSPLPFSHHLIIIFIITIIIFILIIFIIIMLHPGQRFVAL